MDKIIHGICPTCYLVVTEEQPLVSIIGQGGATYYHRNCEPDRMKFMKKNEQRWKEDGEELRKLREENGFSIKEVAEYLQVSETKLRKFESGQPVTHARLLATAIILLIKNFELTIQTNKEAHT